jgi:inner membrane protein involved in colicin E2 resistance
VLRQLNVLGIVLGLALHDGATIAGATCLMLIYTTAMMITQKLEWYAHRQIASISSQLVTMPAVITCTYR